MKEKILKIIARYAKKYGAVELDQLPAFLGKFQKEILKVLGKDFNDLSYGAQNLLGNSWFLIDTLKFQSSPEIFVNSLLKEA